MCWVPGIQYVKVSWAIPLPDLMAAAVWREQGHGIHAVIEGDQGWDGGTTGYSGGWKKLLHQPRRVLEGRRSI